MARLTRKQLAEVRDALANEFSAVRTSIPVNKAELDTVLDEIDVEMESAEMTIFGRLSAGRAKTWLQQNQSIGRRLIEEVVQKRKEEL